MRRVAPISLVRRMVASVVLAVVLVGLVLTGYNYQRFNQTVSDHAALMQLARVMLQGLRVIDNPHDAQAVAATADIMLNAARRDPQSNQGRVLAPLWLELRGADGERLYASAALAGRSLQAQAGQVEAQDLDGRRYWVVRVDDARWSLRLGTQALAHRTALRWVLEDLLPNLLIAFPVALLPVWLAVRRGLRPLSRLSEQLQRRDADDLSPLPVDERYSEIRTVSTAFNGVLDRLRERLGRERAMLQDAAHELRTPMAVIAAQAHVLVQAPGDLERRTAQTQLQQAIDRASHLSQQVLALAALDEPRQAPAQTVDVAELTRRILARHSPALMARRMELSLQAPERLDWPLQVGAFESIQGNLLDNAERYGREGGQVALSLTVQAAAHGAELLCLSVADDGPGIPEAERAHVFERFVRGRGQQVQGAGLGLAIVRQAAQTLGGRVTLAPGLQGRGVGFRVTLPASPS